MLVFGKIAVAYTSGYSAAMQLRSGDRFYLKICALIISGGEK